MEKLPEQNCSENGGWLFQNIHLCFQVLSWQECNMEGSTGTYARRWHSVCSHAPMYLAAPSLCSLSVELQEEQRVPVLFSLAKYKGNSVLMQFLGAATFEYHSCYILRS
jgi:hypothetical protein